MAHSLTLLAAHAETPRAWAGELPGPASRGAAVMAAPGRSRPTWRLVAELTPPGRDVPWLIDEGVGKPTASDDHPGIA